MDQAADSPQLPRQHSRRFAEMPALYEHTTKMEANKAIRQYFNDSGVAPAESGTHPARTSAKWIDIPEIPTEEELMGLFGIYREQEVLLRPNLISQPWRSTEEYLEAHYKLLREDTVAPLRDAIAWVRANPDTFDNKDIAIYEKVHVIRATMTARGIAFRIRFSTRRAGKEIPWRYSSRLISGSLVALSPADDLFQRKCVVATVAARPLDKIINYPPEIDIYFANPDDIEIDSQKEWVMIESRKNYFEATRHTLTALQNLAREKFPLNRHICYLDKNVKVSADIGLNPVLSFQCLTHAPGDGVSYNVLHDLPMDPLGNLNQLQWQALKAMLTQQLVLVQGPPGTGKTHVSVVALQILLSNMVTGAPPIIVAAQTNHALDQLIRQLVVLEKNYVRLGGRSNDLDILQRTLYNIKLTQKNPPLIGGLSGTARKELRDAEVSIVGLLQLLEREHTSQEPLKAADFLEYGLLTKEQVDSLKLEDDGWEDTSSEQEADPLKAWLGDQVSVFQPVYDSEINQFTPDDIDEEYEQLKELEAEQGPEDGFSGELKGRVVSFEISLHGKQRKSIPQATIQKYLQNSDLCKVPVRVRGSIYNYLRVKLLQNLCEKVRGMGKQYADISKRLLIGKWEQNYEILRKAKLVAMTTTGLSKYRGLVASLNPKIVLIEEAAEVIEAPVAVACFETLQQLILVGDHKQLRARCSLLDLAGDPFYLDVSMFERLIGNKLPFVMLREQCRMSPELSGLLQPIYGQLENHPCVNGYPLIPGMGNTRSFFFSHSRPENGDNLSSKVNEMEALMLVEFYVYLLMNGTPASSITVMTFYNGQRKLLLKIIKNHKYLTQLSPKVVTVDSYQGEENDIILLSLVRNNSRNGIGFLAVDNRICVALSRARHGLFLFGNGELLSSVSPLWNEVLTAMASDTNKLRASPTLRLTCLKHGNYTDVTVPGDWQSLNGGCRLLCKETMECGHICSLNCHGYSHKLISCDKPCSYVRPCCSLACTEVCGSPHVHGCDCISEVKEIEYKGKDVSNESVEGIHTPFYGETSRAIHPYSALRTKVLPQRQSIFNLDRIGPSNAGSVNHRAFSSRNEKFVAAGHQRWNAFSSGGAKQMDESLHVLSRAEDLDSEDVKRAVEHVDPSFLPKEILDHIKRTNSMEQGKNIESKKQETGGGDKGEEYYDANEYPPSNGPDDDLSVPVSNLIDLFE